MPNSARSIAKVVLLLGVVAVPISCAANLADDSTSVGSDDLRNARVARYSRPHVGVLRLPFADYYSSPEDHLRCTATLIKPNEILTASHCFSTPTNPYGGSKVAEFEVLGRDGTLHWYGVDGWRTYDGNTTGTRDIAVAHLMTSVPRSVAKPARIRSTRPPDGTWVVQYGYGQADYCSSGTEGIKRRAGFRVGHRPDNVCPGDSGGPVFTPDGQIFVINSTYSLGTGDGFAHPYEFTSWIYSTGAFASSGDYTPPWISSLSVALGPTRVQAAVTDDDGVDLVDFYVDGNLVTFAERGPVYSGEGGLPSSGWHTVTAIAYDYEGNTRTLERAIDFTPPPPPCGFDKVLWPGQRWVSANGQYSLNFQGDGNVVLRSPDGVARWHTNTLNYPGRTASHFKFECTGNLALYDTAGATWWQSNTGGRGGNSFVIQDDCNAVIYSSSGPIWSTGTYHCIPPPPPPPPPCGGLPSGGVLGTDQTMPSCDGRFRLVMQLDGNLVLYQGSVPIWATNTYGSGFWAVMQLDGNFVVYSPTGPRWASNTFGAYGASLAVQNDGNAVIYNGGPIWATNTCCR